MEELGRRRGDLPQNLVSQPDGKGRVRLEIPHSGARGSWFKATS